jgi:hypothetical protein
VHAEQGKHSVVKIKPCRLKWLVQTALRFYAFRQPETANTTTEQTQYETHFVIGHRRLLERHGCQPQSRSTKHAVSQQPA